jgi:hypothetical protein
MFGRIDPGVPSIYVIGNTVLAHEQDNVRYVRESFLVATVTIDSEATVRPATATMLVMKIGDERGNKDCIISKRDEDRENGKR